MDALLVIFLFAATIGLPIFLGRLASDKVRIHAGKTSCARCNYDLSGHELQTGSHTGACPECGLPISDATVFKSGQKYHKPASPWLAVPAVTLLLVPPAVFVWSILSLGFGIDRVLVLLWLLLLYPIVMYYIVKASRSEFARKASSANAIPQPHCESDTKTDPVRGTMHIANYLENHPPSPPPTA
ncbi:MAG: hypothetical protein U0640_12550 [Phycisphaerales bacterium]